MSDPTRWLEELPSDAPERELLLAGRAARPPAGAVDDDWRTLSASLGGAAAGSSATSGIRLKSVAAKAASATLVSKAAAAAPWAVTAKWFALGMALGCGVAGASAVVERASHGAVQPARTAPVVVVTAKAAPIRPSSLRPAARVSRSAEPPSVAVSPAAPVEERRVQSARADVSVRREPPVASEPTALEPEATTEALAEQARELAEVKRLIDAGSASEALRRLTATRRGGAPFALAEERDALYVQALGSAQRRQEAALAAREFLARYPHSPYLEAMQRLLAGE